ncbi:MAG: Rrf2 family transcriptional regulator [Eubacteriales bacterium]|nr:Rrf2 family transcriptional regulator [Eubacteriales bacterium]
MMVSTKGRYALRILIDLAEQPAGEFVSLKAVSERQGISMKYMEAIVAMLSKAGFLESRRGKTGGYRLSCDPSGIRVGAVLKFTEGSLAPVSCMENGGCEECDRQPSCQTHPMWRRLDDLIEDYLEGVSIRDLMEGTAGAPD